MLQKMLTAFAAEKGKDPEKATKALFDNAGHMTGLFRKLETSASPGCRRSTAPAWAAPSNCRSPATAASPPTPTRSRWRLPEVKVGIFPGAGGTQRVPRLTDQQQALQMLTSGQTLSPQKAKAMGLIHEIAEPAKLVETAKAMIRNGLKPVAPWDEKGFKLPGGPIYSAAGFNLWPPAIAILRRETYGNYPAAAAILKCVYEGLLVPFDTGLRIEQRYFTEIMQTKEAAAMIRSLFVSLQELNKGARRPAGVPETKFKKIGILGAGFMGAGIAYVTAKAGIPVVLLDRDMESADKGKAHSDSLISDQVKKGRAKPEEKDKLLSLITPTADYADLAGCDLVVEAVFEDSAVKKSATEQAEAVLKPSAIFASNTSTIPIIVAGQEFGAAEEFHRHPLLLAGRQDDAGRDHPGQEDRRQGAGHRDRLRPRHQEDADRRQRHARLLRQPLRAALHVGSLQDADRGRAGADDRERGQGRRHAGRPAGADRRDGDRPCPEDHEADHARSRRQGRRPEADGADQHAGRHHGRFGRKNGKGFYDYPAKPAKKKLWPGLKDLYPQLAPEKVDYEELKQRLLVTIALEAARVMEEGIVTDPREADVGSILAFGFAPFTGGALSYIDGIGAKEFVKIAKGLQKKYGAEFKAPKLLLDMAEKGETFYQRFDPYAKSEAKKAA